MVNWESEDIRKYLSSIRVKALIDNQIFRFLSDISFHVIWLIYISLELAPSPEQFYTLEKPLLRILLVILYQIRFDIFGNPQCSLRVNL